jgi:NAD(P)-dependent dehydrogenase (short-subunit alcohol dehydrogenase family)
MDSKQVVLVTGSSTGFGRLMVETLARRGHIVFATMRDPAGRNAANASEIRALAAKESLPLHILELDVTNDASVEQAVLASVEQAGRIDVAINNAGYVLVGLAEAVTTEQAQQIMDTNFFGSVRVNRAVLPYMRRQRSGLLLHISSGAGRVIFPSFGFYSATKFALEALAESFTTNWLHKELIRPSWSPAPTKLPSSEIWSKLRTRLAPTRTAPRINYP